jgi:hypothetical protein
VTVLKSQYRGTVSVWYRTGCYPNNLSQTTLLSLDTHSLPPSSQVPVTRHDDDDKPILDGRNIATAAAPTSPVDLPTLALKALKASPGDSVSVKICFVLFKGSGLLPGCA